MQSTDTLGLYIHVPFCGRKCRYCAFYSDSWSKQNSALFTDAVCRNLLHYSDKSRIIDTVYFGGGTPSLLDASQIESIMNCIKSNYNLSDDAEVTLEANPNTLNFQKLCQLRETGVNRLSFGVQSLVDDELKTLGRTHTAERTVKAIDDARKAGFENITCDLMIGIPNQTTETLEYSVNKLAMLPIQHISAYILKVEEGTDFDCPEVLNVLPDEDETADMYLKMGELLKNHGFMQYEVSNFAKKGFEGRHNSRYWKCLDYIGIGPSAHSCYNGKRFAVPSNIEDFLHSQIQKVEVADNAPCGFEERAMLALRLKSGLDLSIAGSRRADIEKKIPMLIKAGYAEYDGCILSLTPKGFLMSNSVIGYVVFE